MSFEVPFVKDIEQSKHFKNLKDVRENRGCGKNREHPQILMRVKKKEPHIVGLFGKSDEKAGGLRIACFEGI